MERRRISFSAAFWTFALIVSLTACSAAGQNARVPGQNGTTRQIQYAPGNNTRNANPNAGPGIGNLLGENNGSRLGNKGSGSNVPYQPSPMLRISGFDRFKAETLEKQLKNIDGAGSVTVIVRGSTALVGYKSTGTTGNTDAVGRRISDKIKQSDKSITQIVLTDSKDTTGKIRQLSSDIRNSRGGADLGSRFDDILRSIKPVGTNAR